jgi:hypothetical protein
MLLPWRCVLVVMPATTIFPDAAVLASGSLGLQPGYAMAVFVVLRVIVEATLGRWSIPKEIVPPILALAAFVFMSVISLWIAVLLFQGRVLVISGTDYFQLSAAAPWIFRRENMTQLLYLGLNGSLVLALAFALCRLPPAELRRAMDRGFVAMIVLAGLFCLWQQLSFLTGVWWPKEFFDSNPGYAYAGGQEMLGGLRVNGSFSEPSSLAFYYSGFLFFSWARLRARASVSSAALVVSCVVALLISKSTTALAVIAAFAVVAVLWLPVGLFARGSAWRPTRDGVLAAAFIVAAMTAGVAWALSDQAYLRDLLDLLVFHKEQGISYLERQGTNLLALDIVAQTWGLGIGIGSHKPDSAALTLLSNTGIAGTVAFVAFVALSMRGARAAAAAGRPVCWFVGGLILVHLFANPNLSMVITWTGFGLALAVAGSAALSATGNTSETPWQRAMSRSPSIAIDETRRSDLLSARSGSRPSSTWPSGF